MESSKFLFISETEYLLFINLNIFSMVVSTSPVVNIWGRVNTTTPTDSTEYVGREVAEGREGYYTNQVKSCKPS